MNHDDLFFHRMRQDRRPFELWTALHQVVNKVDRADPEAEGTSGVERLADRSYTNSLEFKQKQGQTRKREPQGRQLTVGRRKNFCSMREKTFKGKGFMQRLTLKLMLKLESINMTLLGEQHIICSLQHQCSQNKTGKRFFWEDTFCLYIPFCPEGVFREPLWVFMMSWVKAFCADPVFFPVCSSSMPVPEPDDPGPEAVGLAPTRQSSSRPGSVLPL